MAKTIKQIADELNENLDALEHLKTESNYLRGTIEEGLEDPLTGAISDDDLNYLSFMGVINKMTEMYVMNVVNKN